MLNKFNMCEILCNIRDALLIIALTYDYIKRYNDDDTEQRRCLHNEYRNKYC